MDIILRPVTNDDCQFLFDLLAERPAYANISHKAMPSFEDHCRFVNSKPYKDWQIIWVRPECTDINMTMVGAVYLTNHNEIGIAITKDRQGFGYGRRAVETIMAMHGKQQYLANISPNNDRSKNMFKTMGFGLIQETYGRA